MCTFKSSVTFHGGPLSLVMKQQVGVPSISMSTSFFTNGRGDMFYVSESSLTMVATKFHLTRCQLLPKPTKRSLAKEHPVCIPIVCTWSSLTAWFGWLSNSILIAWSLDWNLLVVIDDDELEREGNQYPQSMQGQMYYWWLVLFLYHHSKWSGF